MVTKILALVATAGVLFGCSSQSPEEGSDAQFANVKKTKRVGFGIEFKNDSDGLGLLAVNPELASLNVSLKNVSNAACTTGTIDVAPNGEPADDTYTFNSAVAVDCTQVTVNSAKINIDTGIDWDVTFGAGAQVFATGPGGWALADLPSRTISVHILKADETLADAADLAGAAQDNLLKTDTGIVYTVATFNNCTTQPVSDLISVPDSVIWQYFVDGAAGAVSLSTSSAVSTCSAGSTNTAPSAYNDGDDFVRVSYAYSAHDTSTASCSYVHTWVAQDAADANNKCGGTSTLNFTIVPVGGNTIFL